jgi:hypothetical protein
MVVTVAPHGGQTLPTFLDCTAKSSDPAWTIPWRHEGEHVLVLDPSNPRLVIVPPRPNGDLRLHIRREVQILLADPDSDTADAVVREDVVFGQATSAGIRAALADHEPRDRSKALGELLLTQERLKVLNVAMKNYEDSAQPLEVHLEYRLDNAFHRTGGAGSAFIGKAPAPLESWWIATDDVPHRTTPFELNVSEIDATVHLVPPPGFVAKRSAPSAQSPDANRFLTWSVSADEATGQATLRTIQQAGQFPAADYAAFYDESQRLLKVLDKPIQLEPGRLEAFRAGR